MVRFHRAFVHVRTRSPSGLLAAGPGRDGPRDAGLHRGLPRPAAGARGALPRRRAGPVVPRPRARHQHAGVGHRARARAPRRRIRVARAGAREALAGARTAGFATALWTNNAREVTQVALDRFALADALDLVVTRDDMAEMKPSADGWRVIAARFAGLRDAVVVGDSWVDGLAAAAVGIPFVAYRPREAELERWKVTPIARLVDLAMLPAWLAERDPA